MTSKNKLLVSTLLVGFFLVVAVGCRARARVYLVAPHTLANARVLLDGACVATLSAEPEEGSSAGATAVFDVRPGEHTLIVTKEGFQPVSVEIDCRTECYPAIFDDQIRPLSGEATKAAGPMVQNPPSASTP